MIPYEELDRALARWKARAQNAAGDPAKEFEASGPSGATPAPVLAYGAVPDGEAEIEGLPPPPDRTGEIDLGDAVVESYEEENS
jgi:hypothetical protein